MRPIESWILAYFFNSLWQVPLVFCAALVAARLARSIGARIEHRVWVSALLLEAVLPLCQFHPDEWLRRAWETISLLSGGSADVGKAQISIGLGATHGIAAMGLPAGARAAIAAVYLCILLYFVARLGWRLWATSNLLHKAEAIALPDENAQKLEICRQVFGIDGGAVVRVACLPEMAGPATVGVLRHTLLLPEGFIHQVGVDDMEAVLAHECAHISRQDFAKNLLYEMVSLSVAYHPLLSITRVRLAETRELVCDEMAVEALPGRENYARSLLRLASMLAGRATPRLLHAIGILDANIFERRIMNLTRKTGTIGYTRRLLAVAGCGLIAVVTCISAMALQTDVPSQPAQSSAPVEVKPSDVMKNMLTKVAPIYPPEAKAEHVQGTVVLEAIIGKDGQIQSLHVLSGPAMLQQASLDAVKHWVYKPYLLNGSPVEVKTKINIKFTLADKSIGKKPNKG